MTSSFAIAPLDTDLAEDLRDRDFDDQGLPVAHVVATGGEPLRCCLRDARPDESLLLVNYEPPLPAASPYQQRGAVFVHDAGCSGPAAEGYPADWLGRAQVLRAYDARGWIHPASRAHDGSDAAAELAAVLATDGVVEVHSHNIAYGCYMFRAVRG